MKKIYFLFLCLLLSYSSCVAQKQDRTWIFGDSAGIDFNNLANPALIASNAIGTYENFTCISDTSGQLLFYLNGYDTLITNDENTFYLRFCNNSGHTMAHGDSIYTNWTETQGSLIIPYPGQSEKYFAIYKQYSNASLAGFPYGLFSSIIDMNQNGGLGSVVNKNNILISNRRLSEKVAAVKHANGRDWWILTHGVNNNRFYEFLVDPQGIHGPVLQNIGSFCDSLHLGMAGQMKFSPDGSRLVSVNMEGMCDLFNFDRCTGLLSNWDTLGHTAGDQIEDNRFYGCEFSPNSSVLYASTTNENSGVNEYLYQWDLIASNISASRLVLWQRNNSTCNFGQQKLGPDGKIYFANAFGCWSFINVINFPNSLGIACGLGSQQFSLGSHYTQFGLPNIPNYNLGVLTGSACDTLGTGMAELMTDNMISAYPNPALNSVTLESSRWIAEGMTDIIDVTGRVIISKEIKNQNELTFDVSDLPAGIYFVELKTSQGIAVKKFMKN